MAIFDQATATLRPVGQDGVPRAGIGADWNNLAPRVGASWLLRDDGSWLLRGGYGIYYDASTLIENSALYFNPPFFTFRVFAPGGPVLPTAADPFPEAAGFEPPISVNTLAPEFPTAHRHQGSLGIETRVRGVDVSARWVGASGTSLVRKRNLNQPPPGPGAGRRAPADSRLRRHPSGRGRRRLGVARAAVARRAAPRAGPVAARRLHLGQVDRRRVGVSGQRGQRQHAPVERPARPRTGPVGLRRPPSRCRGGHLGSAADGSARRWGATGR